MAFGGLIGTFSAGNTSIPNPFTASLASGSGVVSVGDVVYGTVAEQTSATTTAVSDNLGNTYAILQTTSSTNPTSVSFYGIITVAGTITAISATTTASSHNASIAAEIITGPVSALDKNPTDLTSTAANTYTCPATGTLVQANEIVCCFIAQLNVQSDTVATSPNLLAILEISTSSAQQALGYQAVSSTSSVTPVFTSVTGAQGRVQGTASFKKSAAGSGGLFRAALLNGLGSGGSMITNPLG